MVDARLLRWLPLLVGIAAAPSSAQDAEAEIRAVFEAYRTAAIEQDGDAAAEAVSASSLAASARHVALALDADSATVAALPLVDRYTVLAMRHRVAPDTLRAFDGRAAYAYGIRNGWTDGLALRLVSLGDVTVRGDSATATVLVADVPQPDATPFPFVRTDGRWRLDVARMAIEAAGEFRDMVAASGMADDAFILYALRMLSGTDVTDAVWRPVGRASGG